MKRTLTFKDAENNKVVFEAEITTINGYPEFTASGEYCGSAGQVFDQVKPATEEQKQLIDLWHKWHLNNKDNPLPDDFGETLNSLMDEIEETEELGAIPVTEEHTELFEDFEEPETAHALALILGLNTDDIPDIEENGDNSYSVQGVDYLCGTDDEMNEKATEEIEQSVWAFNSSFLASYCDISYEVFDALQPQCEGANDAILSLIESKGSIEDFAQEAIDTDGRGHFLNHWDGSEEEIELNGTYYYACRQ
jgi:hypothetical protein